MHEKLVKQLRNKEHCVDCPYDKDCNEFDSCLMDLLAADAIEDMTKRIERQEKELQEKDLWIQDKERIYCCPVCSSDYNQKISSTLVRYHTSGTITHKFIETKFCPSCGRKLG
jgi:rubrerythrin